MFGPLLMATNEDWFRMAGGVLTFAFLILLAMTVTRLQKEVDLLRGGLPQPEAAHEERQ
jgi:hypothetical protein